MVQMLTMGANHTLILGFVSYITLVVIFMLLYALGGKECSNVQDYELYSVEHLRVTYFLRYARPFTDCISTI